MVAIKSGSQEDFNPIVNVLKGSRREGIEKLKKIMFVYPRMSNLIVFLLEQISLVTESYNLEIDPINKKKIMNLYLFLEGVVKLVEKVIGKALLNGLLIPKQKLQSFRIYILKIIKQKI